MTDKEREQLERRILILAPAGKDADLTAAVLNEARIECVACRGVEDLAQALQAGAGAVLLTEEALARDQKKSLANVLAGQPAWSDLPILILTRPGADSATAAQALRTLGNVTLLERPTRVSTLVSAVQAALRARRRQYQLRNREQRLADELEAVTQLHALSQRLVNAPDLQTALEEVLDASIQITRADFGNIQLYNPVSQTLEIKAHRGATPEYVEHFRSVKVSDGSTCARAMRGTRVIVEDVETDPDCEPHREVARAMGFRAVQSTPLMSRGGKLLGVLSTHFRRPHRPSERDLRIIDLYARQAADFWDDLRAHEALRQSETELGDFFENANVGMHWADPDGVILRVNQAELNMLGYRREEYVGHRLVEFYENPARFEDLMKRLAAGEKLQGYTARLRAKDGSIKDVLINSSVLWEQGKFIHTRCFTLDVTGRKQAEKKLRESQEQLAFALAGSGAATWSWDVAANRLDDWTPEYRELYGFSADEPAAFDSWIARIHPADRERILDRVQKMLQTPGDDVWDEEFRILHPETGLHWIAGRGRCFRDQTGRGVRMAGVNLDISARKWAEEALRESRDVLSLAMRGGRMGAWSRDIATDKVWWSRELEEIFGLEPGGFSGMQDDYLALVHPDDRAALRQAVDTALANHEDYSVEFRFRHASGEWRWMEGRGRAVYGAVGQPVTLYGLGIDITERKHAEEMRVLHTAIVESSDDAIMSKTLDGIILSWNRSAERLFGYGANEAIGQPISLIIPPDKHEEELALLKQLQQGQGIDQYQTVRLTRSGRLIDVSLTVSALRDRHGRIIGASTIVRDITAQKHAESALHQHSERQRLLWEAAAVLLTTEEPDAMMRALFAKIAPHFKLDSYFNFMVEPTGDALRLQSCIGIPQEEAHRIGRLEFGQAVCGHVALQRRPIVATHIQQSDDPKVQLVKGYGIRAYACNPLISQGQLLGTLSFASRQRDYFDPDELDFLKTICHYITVAYERARLVRELRESHRRKDEFLATLAHELRNPLAPIHNALHILRMEGSASPAVTHVGEMIQRQVNYMVRLVDDLMEVSRITRGKIELRKETVELAVVLRNAIETSQPLIDAARHQLHVSIPPEPLYLEGDFVRLGQIFANVLNNAAKYTEAGGQIWLSARRQQNGVIVSVRDSGVGIPADMLPHVFEIFTQVDRSPGRSQGGLGIGLTLVRSLIGMHGGSVEARSEGLGQGSEFIIRLPLLADKQAVEEKRPDAKPPTVLSRRVLVVDDNRDAADSLGTLLKILGAEVKVVYDGPSAIEAVRAYRPAVVLLDIGMPGMDGYEVARRIHQQPESRDVTLIALTGWGQEEDRRQSQTAGFDHHLVKPADVSTLQALLISLEGSSQTKH